HQYVIEVFGSQDASIEAEIVSLGMRALTEDFGIKVLSLNINSLGCPKCRAKFTVALKHYLKANYDTICETCKTIFEKNP
ncbi:histidine--tRNA ligase, partial [Clostridium perfringens]